jgi:predicted metalloendopeptidase
MNYGAIGAVIGHEISHSFDNQGALFDDTGALKNWWTPQDFAHFSDAGKKLAAQYDAYHPLPDLALKGQQVLAENIADLAGLAVAYDAWKMSLHGKPAPVVQGLNGDEQFFIAYGQSWRSKLREPLIRQRVLTDGHSPAEFRVATVRNLDPFYAAFKTAPGHALYLAPEDRIRVW